MPDMNENAETQQEYLGRCHDCTAPQTEVNMLSRHILELQADKGRLIDKVNELEAQIEKIINEIDKTMVLSTMRECEICNIQDIFRKYGFKRNSKDVWEIKEK